jgi:hypothetical protein
MKIRLVGAELCCIDERAHITKLVVSLRYFVKAPKN